MLTRMATPSLLPSKKRPTDWLHVRILESYDVNIGASTEDVQVLAPFAFSANSERSLTATLSLFSSFLKSNPGVNLQDLAFTLSRRSALALKTTLSASTAEELVAQIDEKLDTAKDSGPVGTRTLGGSKILGVFTGQGAQWPRMGRQLLRHCDLANEVMLALERSLQDLPESDRPSWSIRAELFKDASESRLGEAALSQPLCTAVQIVLVELLRSAGVAFEAVVGHSSGEITAAYVSGFISARDAIRIAYYRGFHAKLACGRNGESGAMLAVGAKFSDAIELCNNPEFQGRVSAAASNSPSSVTLSGDSEAINAAKDKFDDSKIFARLLKVDTAYHSHHMIPCSEPYVQSLMACGVQVQAPPDDACTWFSSVYLGEKMTPRRELQGTYWRDNMVNAVLFSQAIESAVSEKGSFDFALEVGPHAALKGPATQTLQDIGEDSLPYLGVLSRGTDDVRSFSNTLGSLWCHMGQSAVDITSCHVTASRGAKARILKGLPSYVWDHDRRYWAESRKSKAIRDRNDPVHQLLGRKTPECTDDEIRWSNVLKPKEISWLPGHQLQGQTIFPAAGYIGMALEAAMICFGDKEPQLVEILDFVIARSLPFNDDATGVETLFALSTMGLANKDTSNISTAHFKCYAGLHKDSTNLTLISSGALRITHGQPSDFILPPGTLPPSNMVNVDIDRFYDNLGELGYGYNGVFRGLTSIRRKMGIATGSLIDPALENSQPQLLVHPATLDVSIQAIMAAYSYPGDGRLWSLHVPTEIKRITVNPHLCQSRPKVGSVFRFDTVATNFRSSGVRGDIRLYGEKSNHSMIEVEGLKFVPLSAAAPSNDLPMFSANIWNVANPNAEDCPNHSDEGKAVRPWIARLARQVVHRYPHMKILQIGK